MWLDRTLGAGVDPEDWAAFLDGRPIPSVEAAEAEARAHRSVDHVEAVMSRAGMGEVAGADR